MRKINLNKISFNMRITIATIILILIGQIATGLISKSVSEKYLEAQYSNQASMMAEQLAPLFLKEDIQTILSHYKGIEGIEYILTTDNEATILAHSDGIERIEELGGNLVDDIAIKTALSGNDYTDRFFRKSTQVWVFDASLPVYNNNKIIGAVNVGLDMSDYFESRSIIVRNIVLGSMLSVFAISLILVFLIRFLTKDI
jgi:sensor histidine kinase regulating citrate/malate metabolism